VRGELNFGGTISGMLAWRDPTKEKATGAFGWDNAPDET
jgi:hypothetical protein